MEFDFEVVWNGSTACKIRCTNQPLTVRGVVDSDGRLHPPEYLQTVLSAWWRGHAVYQAESGSHE